MITFNLVFTAFIGIYEFFSKTTVCILGKGCEIVQTSDYASLMGINLSILGIIALAALFILYALSLKEYIPYSFYVIPCYIGTILAAYFIYLQVYVIQALCTTCMITDVAMILTGLVTLVNLLKE